MKKVCKKCSTAFEITEQDLEFYNKISPKINGIKYEIPTPTFCPTCRQQRRLSWRNERKFYRNTCSLTGKSIISIHSPDSDYKVYEQSKRRGDDFDAKDYGKDFDFSRPFFEQYEELLKATPRPSLYIQNVENSDYTNFESDTKNCYLTIGGHWNENCMYGTYHMSCTNCIDNYWLFDSQNSMGNIISYNLYECHYLQYSKNCRNCTFGIDLEGCKDCFGCIGLNNQQYCIFNKQYSKEAYEAKMKKIDLSKHETLDKYREEFKEFVSNEGVKTNNIKNSENCTGNNIFNSKNCENGFFLEDVEDSKHCFVVGMAKSNMDVTSAGLIDFSYEVTSGGMKSYHCLFTMFSYGCVDTLYSDNCHYSNNLFGCIGLINQEYCILNKKYSKKEYETLVSKIIEHMKKTGEWGEYFPSEISPFGYNESMANEYFSLTKDEANKQGFKWQNKEFPINIPDGMATLNSENLPDLEDLTPELEYKILNSAIICEESGKAYRIINKELEFYKKHQLPLPRKHQDVRHLERFSIVNQGF